MANRRSPGSGVLGGGSGAEPLARPASWFLPRQIDSVCSHLGPVPSRETACAYVTEFVPVLFWLPLAAFLGCLLSPPATAQIQKDQLPTLLPTPEELGEGWKWTNPGRPYSDLGFQFTAYYDFRAEEQDNASAVVNIRTHGSDEEAVAACQKNRKRYEAADGVVLVDLPELGPNGFQWHHESNERYGPRVTFCTQNLFVTIGPSLKSLEAASALFEAFAPPGQASSS